MTNQLLWILISAVSGGMIRGIVGVAKSLWPNKQQEFKLDYFLFNLLLSAFIGAIAGILAGRSEEMASLTAYSNQIAFLAGYAGPDFWNLFTNLSLAKYLRKRNYEHNYEIKDGGKIYSQTTKSFHPQLRYHFAKASG